MSRPPYRPKCKTEATTRPTGPFIRASCAKSTTFWFEDGTVVLQVEDTLFRVHWGVLKLHSRYFSKLYDSKDLDADGVIDFCPVVTLQDDMVTDWEEALNRIYVASGDWTGADLNLGKITSVARIAKKYDFQGLASDSERLLLSMCPAPNVESRDRWLLLYGRHSIGAFLNIAVELEFKPLLVIFYYLCAMEWTTNEILDGINVQQTGDSSTIRYQLSAQVQSTVLSGRDRMRMAIARLLKDQQWCSTDGCELSREAMLDARLSFLTGLEDMKWAERRLLVSTSRLCPSCKGQHQDILHRETEFWSMVPMFFGLTCSTKEKENKK